MTIKNIHIPNSAEPNYMRLQLCSNTVANFIIDTAAQPPRAIKASECNDDSVIEERCTLTCQACMACINKAGKVEGASTTPEQISEDTIAKIRKNIGILNIKKKVQG